MKLSRREVVLALVSATVALYGVTAILARSTLDEWRELRQDRAKVLDQIARDKAIAGERGQWAQQFADLNQEVPPIPPDQKVDIQWMSLMDRIAAKNGVTISKRQVGEEKKIGDIYEIPVECKDFEGGLEPIVRFLFELQDQGAMLDMRQLELKPKTASVLRGRFTLYCAYTRQEASK